MLKQNDKLGLLFFAGILFSFVLAVIVLRPGHSLASSTNGTIFNNAAVATSTWAWGDNLGWINFKCNYCDVKIYDNSSTTSPHFAYITGHVWSPQFGWINLHASTTDTNISPDAWGLNVDKNGYVYGTAWSSMLGWIDFSTSSTNSVSIVASSTLSQFLGRTTNPLNYPGGKISFDCPIAGGFSTSTCISNSIGVYTDYVPYNLRKTYGITVTVTGLTGTVVLLNNGTDSLSVSANGTSTFAIATSTGGVYNVSVTSNPSNQSCAVSSPSSGTVSGTGNGNIGTSTIVSFVGPTITCTTQSSGGGGGGGGVVITPTPTPSATTIQTVSSVCNKQYAGVANQAAFKYLLGDIFTEGFTVGCTDEAVLTQKHQITYRFRADINDDKTINLQDFNLLMINWNKHEGDINSKTPGEKNVADLNLDTWVNLQDFNLLMVHWNKTVHNLLIFNGLSF